jgi:hypothetical protein
LKASAERGLGLGCGSVLTGSILILVAFAVVPALVIQAWNEYDLRIAREADIRRQVVQTTTQIGEEIGELREGARELLFALAQLNTVKTRQPGACSPLFSKLKARFANYGLLGAAHASGRIFCDVGLASAATVISVAALLALCFTSFRLLERGIHDES